MLPYSIFLVANFTLFLSGLCGLIVLFVLFFLLILNRRKNKKLLFKNNLLEHEINLLQNELMIKSKSSDDEISLKTKELQDKIKSLKSIEIDQKIALKKAEEANFLKNAFLASMSLEIRTPLNGIIGFSSELLGEIEHLQKPELVDFAKGITESSNRLLHLMDHIIDLSRIDSNDYDVNLSIFEVNSVIKNCIDKFKDSALKKNLVLKNELKEIYLSKGDKIAFEKAFDLILDNAVKYTPEGRITITSEHEKSNLNILVSDTGIGIDKNFLSDIFQAFRQKSTGYSRLQQGAGLGLPLAKKLMLLTEGDIQLKSDKGKGTQVLLTLPLAKIIQPTFENKLFPVESEIQISTIEKKLPFVFIVEDDKMNRLLFDKMLAVFANIQMAVDGNDAFMQLEKVMQSGKLFDIILLDINLPSPWDGMMLLKEFKKKWPILNKTPFVAQTAYANTGDKEKFLTFGFDDYISKPIDKRELFTIIENNLRKFAVQKS